MEYKPATPFATFCGNIIVYSQQRRPPDIRIVRCIYGHTCRKGMDQQGKVANTARDQLNTRKIDISLSAFVPEKLVSRDEFGSPVPRQPAHRHTQADMVLTYRIPPEFRGGVHLFSLNRHTPSGQSRGYQVTQSRTDGVHCRESAGTAPVNLKVVPNGCCLGRSPWTI